MRADILSQAAALGIDERELLGSLTTRRPRSPSNRPAKYRNSETGELWSGQGRGMPDWMKNPIDAGLKTREDFINPTWLSYKKYP